MRSILVVEDSSTIREMVVFVLKDEELRIVEAEDGEEALALAKAKKKPFDLIITDQNMPCMTGLELSAELRGMEEYKDTPILMLTTESDPRLKQRGKEIGITGWVLKPLSPKAFKAAIEKLLEMA